MDSASRRLAGDEQPGTARQLEDGPWPERKFVRAAAAGAHLGQKGGKVVFCS